MTSTNHPSFEELFLRAAREPYPTESTVESHLRAGCPDCVRRERVVDAVLRAIEAGPLPAPPRAWRDRAVALGRRAAAFEPAGVGLLEATQRTLGRVTEILARLVPAGAPGPALALRGPGAADRHLLYRAGPFEVDLALFDSGALVGHVLAAEPRAEALAGGVCVLVGSDGAREAPLEGGDFHFGSVQPGSYDLLVESPSLRLFVPELDLTDSEEAS